MNSRTFPRSPRILALLGVLATPALSQTEAPKSTVPFATEEDIAAAVARTPCDNKDRLAAVVEEFKRVGVPEADILLDEYPHVTNVMVKKPGASREIIVLGAHYDKVRAGCGAVDNWTGIIALTQLYRTLVPVKLQKTIVFVAFGREEEGLKGAIAMVKGLAEQDLPNYCAMINLDSLGITFPQVASNLSQKHLAKKTTDLAEGMKIKIQSGEILGNADSAAFVGVGIPAVTIHGLNDKFRSILHSPNDQIKQVKPMSVYLGYHLTLALIDAVDKAPCDAWRHK